MLTDKLQWEKHARQMWCKQNVISDSCNVTYWWASHTDNTTPVITATASSFPALCHRHYPTSWNITLPAQQANTCSKSSTAPVKHAHTRLTALCMGLPGWAGTRKVKPIWILLKQEIVSGNGISWAICKSAPCSRQITTPAPHHSVFYWPDALPAAQPTVSKHWRHCTGQTELLFMHQTVNQLMLLK